MVEYVCARREGLWSKLVGYVIPHHTIYNQKLLNLSSAKRRPGYRVYLFLVRLLFPLAISSALPLPATKGKWIGWAGMRWREVMLPRHWQESWRYHSGIVASP